MIYILKPNKLRKQKTPDTTSNTGYVTVYLCIIASGLHLHYTFCFLTLLMGWAAHLQRFCIFSNHHFKPPNLHLFCQCLYSWIFKLLISSNDQGRFTRNTALCVFVLEQTHINVYFYFLLGLIHFFKSHLIQPGTQNRVLIILLSTVTQTMQLHPFVFVQGH